MSSNTYAAVGHVSRTVDDEIVGSGADNALDGGRRRDRIDGRRRGFPSRAATAAEAARPRGLA